MAFIVVERMTTATGMSVAKPRKERRRRHGDNVAGQQARDNLVLGTLISVLPIVGDHEKDACLISWEERVESCLDGNGGLGIVDRNPRVEF